MSQLELQLDALPAEPGIYLFKNRDGEVIYIGKAVSLYHRVKSYFGSPSHLTPKLQRMVAQIADLDFFLTDSEQEAFLLECNLIKRYHPRYNVRLKDDKSYPYLKINLREDWPHPYVTRRLEDDGARYFGPFASASSVRRTLNLLKKLFPFRSCHKKITGKDSRACLEYHLHRCLGPCIGAVSQEEYRKVLNQVILFLQGKQEQILKELRHKMNQAARKLEFEKAAILRDQIEAVKKVIEHQKIASPYGEVDVIALAQPFSLLGTKDEAYVEVFFIRHGKLIGREHFMVAGSQDEPPGQIYRNFITQFYQQATYIPSRILLQYPFDEMPLAEKWLGERKGGKIELRLPQSELEKELMAMVAENARQGMEQLRIKLLAEPEAATVALEELQQNLQLPKPPRRIEAYDISNIQGTSAVGSMVVFEEGLPKKSLYRKFRIKEIAQPDDYGMMQEVLRRRFRRTKAEGDGSDTWAVLPDLVLVDGGKGQLNVALKVLGEFELDFIPCAGLAKENESLFLPNRAEPLMLTKSAALFLLERVRDEAHRFAIGYYQKVHHRKSLTSGLDEIPGIGPKRKQALLRRFGSMKGIKEASADELTQVKGMNRPVAEKLKELL
jgi:excinuclease ABC subunit C